MRFYGPIVGFSLASRGAAESFLSGCKFIAEATSFGGIHTTAERRARWGGDSVPQGFVRMSVGCEDARDLIADIKHALGQVKSA